MNNKKLGTAFEREVCRTLATKGYWVHFIAPDERGAQPFDIIAVKDGIARAIECKTSSAKTFSATRLEDNQHLAFHKWKRCGNTEPLVAIKYNDELRFVEYSTLMETGKINLKGETRWVEL